MDTNGRWSHGSWRRKKTRVSRYQKKHSPTHINPDNQPSFISFLHLLRPTSSSLFNLRAWQSFYTTSLQVLFGLPLGLERCTSYCIHSSSNHCLLLATHAHTIATRFAVVPWLCHLILVSPRTHSNGEVYFMTNSMTTDPRKYDPDKHRFSVYRMHNVLDR